MAISSGCLLKDHLPALVFEEMEQSLKSGGLMVFSMRDSYWHDADFMGYKLKLDQMCSSNQIKFSKRLIFNKYEGMREEDGTAVGIFKEQPASVHIYKKL